MSHPSYRLSAHRLWAGEPERDDRQHSQPNHQREDDDVESDDHDVSLSGTSVTVIRVSRLMSRPNIGPASTRRASRSASPSSVSACWMQSTVTRTVIVTVGTSMSMNATLYLRTIIG